LIIFLLGIVSPYTCKNYRKIVFPLV